MEYKTQYEKMIAAARQVITDVEVVDVKTMLENDEDFILLDIRTENEWKAGHLPKAQHLDRGRLESKVEKAIPNNETKIIVYCGGGGRSVLVAETLQKMNYTNVFLMADGYRAWNEAGYPLVSEA